MPSNSPSLNRAAWAAVVLGLTLAAMPAYAQRRAPSPTGCSESQNLYGPFDYRTATPGRKALVENAHFTHGVETLTRGKTGAFGGDIGYTLAVFPNHVRAIMALERLIQKEKKDPPQGAEMTLDCYYVRGMNYVPDDLVFRMVYVSSLIRRNQPEEARRFLDYVVSQAGDSALTHFNAGLLYADMKDYDQALTQAHRVITLGMTRTELRDRLTAVGRWKEPEPVAVPAEPASAAAAASAASAASQTSR